MHCLNFIGETSGLEECIDYLSKKMNFIRSGHGTCINISKREKGGLTVSGKDGIYEISYGFVPDFCRALCHLLDRLTKKDASFCIEEDRKLKSCGIMADVSRNAVLTVDAVKDIISRIARMGMDTMMLYMEDIYKVNEYPYFGYMRGAYTEDELREIDRFAKSFGVEVVACIQTLSHLANVLRWPTMRDFKDTYNILLVDEAKTYEFIKRLVSTISRCLSSDRIHIGMDEAFGLGTGEYFRRHGSADKLEMITRHLNKVVDILSEYGKKPLMWGDMFFCFASEKGEFYDTSVTIPQEITNRIPKNVTLAYWDYYNEDIDICRTMIKNFKNMQRDVAFFGGVWTWNGVAVNYDKTFRTSVPALKACGEGKIDEIYATLWGDDGAETSIYTALLGIQMYAEAIYKDNVTKKRLYEMFEICTGYNAESFILLDADNFPQADNFKKKNPTKAVAVSKQILYQDILQGLFDRQYENIDLKHHYEKLLCDLSSAPVPHDLRELFDYHMQLIKVLHLKCDLGLKITNNYRKNDTDALRENICELNELLDEVSVLHEKLSVLWFKNNKPFGIDRIDLRFGGLKERIKRAQNRLNDYISGKICSIAELEEERLMFDDKQFFTPTAYRYFATASI